MPFALESAVPNRCNNFCKAALELAIMMEIMKAQRGGISVDDNPGDRIVFASRFSQLTGSGIKTAAAARRMNRVDPKKDHIVVITHVYSGLLQPSSLAGMRLKEGGNLAARRSSALSNQVRGQSWLGRRRALRVLGGHIYVLRSYALRRSARWYCCGAFPFLFPLRAHSASRI